MVETNLEFEVVYDDAISMPLVYLFSIVSFHVYFDVSYKVATKDGNTNTCGNCQYKPLF
jgi:hypothetical protein